MQADSERASAIGRTPLNDYRELAVPVAETVACPGATAAQIAVSLISRGDSLPPRSAKSRVIVLCDLGSQAGTDAGAALALRREFSLPFINCRTLPPASAGQGHLYGCRREERPP